MFLKIDLLGEAEASHFDIFSLNFAKVYIGRVDIAVNDPISMDIVDSLCQLVEDLPDLVLLDPFIFCLGFSDKILEGAALAKLHDYINGVILPIDLKVKISEDMDIVHVDKCVNLVDDVLFLLGRHRRK